MKISSLLLFLLVSNAAPAQKNEISILNNRFYLTFPDSARKVTGANMILAPGSAENNETTIVYEIGDEKLTFSAIELNKRTVENLVERLTENGNREKPSAIKVTYNKDSCMAILITRKNFDNEPKIYNMPVRFTADVMLSSFIIQNPDRTLSRVSAFINAAAFAERSKFQKIAEDVFSTFREGERRVSFAPHIDSFAIMGTKAKIKIYLPQDYITYAAITDKQFDAYMINRVTSYGDTTETSLMINFEFVFLYSIKPKGIKSTTYGEFMFHVMPWDNYFDTTRSLFEREQLFYDDEIKKGVKIYIAMQSPKAGDIEDMSGIVKNLLIVYDPDKVK